jgi:hypothetical protein
MPLLRRLRPGTTVIACVDCGPVMCGQLGMVVGRKRRSLLSRPRTVYDCTFLGGIHVTASAREIMPFDHGYSRPMLEDPMWFLHTRDVVVERGKVTVDPGGFWGSAVSGIRGGGQIRRLPVGRFGTTDDGS